MIKFFKHTRQTLLKSKQNGKIFKICHWRNTTCSDWDSTSFTSK